MRSYLVLLALFFMFSTSCKTSQMLEALAVHRANILQASGANVDPSEKLDVLGLTFAAVLDESLRYTSVKKTVRHVDKFSKQNKKELDAMITDVSKWVNEMDGNEKRKFVLGLATKRYTLDIIRLVPKVEKKISRRIGTFLFFNRLLKVIKPGNLLGL